MLPWSHTRTTRAATPLTCASFASRCEFLYLFVSHGGPRALFAIQAHGRARSLQPTGICDGGWTKRARFPRVTFPGHTCTDTPPGPLRPRGCLRQAKDHPQGAVRPVYSIASAYPRLVDANRAPAYAPVDGQVRRRTPRRNPCLGRTLQPRDSVARPQLPNIRLRSPLVRRGTRLTHHLPVPHATLLP